MNCIVIDNQKSEHDFELGYFLKRQMKKFRQEELLL
jgi:hypothetical protein